jgi:predicted short-subunit dehydrogenase-like oxidoreductase (DUF2520 family)
VTPARNVALIGPGRAGTALAVALVDRGWRVTAVAGRAPDAASTVAAADRLVTRATPVNEVGRGAALVLVATPDRAIEGAVLAAAPSLERDTLVVHIAGSRGLDVFTPLLGLRPDVRVGALHPLQTFPSPAAGVARLAGSWAAVAGDDAVVALAEELGLRSFTVPDHDRTRYHATAVVASNHVVALLGQVERLAKACGVPPEAFATLVEASVNNALTTGAAGALTGPVQRGDLGTIAAHLRSLEPSERVAYRALAREAARLTGRHDPALERLLDAGAAADDPPSE